MKTKQRRKPNRRTFPTSFALTQPQRDRLRAIEQTTGVPQSVTVRRLLDEHLPEAAGTTAP